MNAPKSSFQALDVHYRARVQESFSRQKAMALIGASLTVVEPGYVEIALPYRDELTQQKGYAGDGRVQDKHPHAGAQLPRRSGRSDPRGPHAYGGASRGVR